MKILLLVLLIGAVIYLVVRLVERRRVGPRPKPQRSDPRVTGPDDDPDFLRGLDRPDDDR